jgi:nondiscriminating aspartyl-tRNA synthetase
MELFGVVKDIREFKWGGFLILETFSGQYQCVLKDLSIDLKAIKPESYVKLTGEFVNAQVKKDLVNHEKEFVVSAFDTITEPALHPAINIYEKELSADVHLIFDKRAFTLRNEKNRCVFKIQSFIHNEFRNFLTQKGFISISTPKIVANGAEGGTNVFKFDYFGREAYLAQSPQLYKQMMCGVFGKVYETAPVFRAEKHASSRHLNEYLSLDLEMVLQKNFFELIEIEKEVLYHIFYNVQRKMSEELKYLGFENLSKESNPNTALILKVSEIKEILGTSGLDMSSEEERQIAEYALQKHNTEFVFATHYHREARPFYTKLSPDGITTESFDCIYKGVEITSGGQRKEQLQEYLDALKDAEMNQEPFESYLDTFRYGMPLHGGFAIGLERLTAKLCGLDSAKAATLFPRDVERLIP